MDLAETVAERELWKQAKLNLADPLSGFDDRTATYLRGVVNPKLWKLRSCGPTAHHFQNIAVKMVLSPGHRSWRIDLRLTKGRRSGRVAILLETLDGSIVSAGPALTAQGFRSLHPSLLATEVKVEPQGLRLHLPSDGQALVLTLVNLRRKRGCYVECAAGAAVTTATTDRESAGVNPSPVALEPTNLFKRMDQSDLLSTAFPAGGTSKSSLLNEIDLGLLKSGRIHDRREFLGHAVVQADPLKWQGKLDHVNAILTELDPQWLPAVGAIATKASQAEPLHSETGRGHTVAHLHKVSVLYDNAGAATRNENIVQQQMLRGHDPFVIYPLGYPSSNDSGIKPRDHEHFMHVSSDDVRSLGPKAGVELHTLRCAQEVTRRGGADVIHAASGVRGYELAITGQVLRLQFGVPLVYEVRSMHEQTWGGDPELRDDAELTKLRERRELQCAEAADMVVTLCDSMREELVGRGVDRDRIHVVPNAVDLERFTERPADSDWQQRFGIRPTAVVLGYVSNFSYREGHETLILAAKKLRDQGHDVQCLLIGGGPTRADLESRYASADIIFGGEVDHDEVAACYALIDVFVVPRRADYAADLVTPMKPFEAMSMNRTVVVSDRPALAEIVGLQQERGFIFRSEDVDDLVATVLQVLDDPSEAALRASNALTWVNTERSWKKVVGEYDRVYEQAIDNYNGSTSGN